MGRLINHSKCGFTTVNNAYLRDTNLSMEEMGLLTFLRSCSDGFVVNIRGLTQCLNSGEKAIRSAMCKLIEKGYVARVQAKSDNGKYGNMDYVSFDSLEERAAWDTQRKPNTETPCAEKPCAENRRAENRRAENRRADEGAQRNNNIRNTNKERTKEDIYSAHTRFQKPSIEDVRAYIFEQGYKVDADTFFDYYESKGWTVGKSPMKDWKAAIRNWNRNQKQKAPHEETAEERMQRFMQAMQG